ncbi:hypothetical protein HDU96_000910 [Phlyctochytrium bullatum]|nr:hypothetical protein HDU96_000910 [Phlyctochytrium bullatum]
MDSVKEEAGASEAIAETSYHLEGVRLHDDDKPRLSEASIPVFVVTSSEDQEQGESKFIRIKVNVDRPPTAFTVVVDKTQTVEYLSHLIEAIC